MTENKVTSSIGGFLVFVALFKLISWFHSSRQAEFEALMPIPESKFIEAIRDSYIKYQSAPTDMMRPNLERLRAERRDRICEILNSQPVTNWMGKIKTLEETPERKGILAVSISELFSHQISLTTNNNSFSESVLKVNTFIEPGSPLFSTVSAMKIGQEVVFSGRFFHSDRDCAQENSLTTIGSMTEPEFLFRFESVRSR